MPLFPPLVVEHDFEETGRGYRCLRDIKQGEELLAIPLGECWTAADARATAQLKPVMDADPELSDVNVTALHLLVERAKGPQSTRWAHLQQLPIEYDSTLFWSAEQLSEIKGSPWHELATRFTEEAREDWATLRQAVAKGATPESRVLLDGISERDYLWAYTTVKSRTAEVLLDGEKASLLAPDFDMFNHCDALTPGSTHFFDEPRRALVVVAARDYVEGEQAFISYGTASNGSLLLAGGFVLPSNRFDYVECPLTTQCDSGRLILFMMTAPEVGDPNELATFEFLELPTDEDCADGAVVPLVTRHLLTKAVPMPPPLLGYVRLECMSGEEIETAKRKGDKMDPKKPLYELLVGAAPLDAINELVSLASLRASFVAMAAAYPTTLAADRLALARGGMAELASRDTVDGRSQAAEDEAAASARRRLLALVLRSSEKEILSLAAAELEARFDKQLHALVKGAAAQAAACREAGSSWPSMLMRRENVLQQQAERIGLHFERLQAGGMGGDLRSAALLAQTASAFLLLIGGLGAHPLARSAAFVPAAWPFGKATADAADAADGADGAPPPPLTPEMLALMPTAAAAGGEVGMEEELAPLALYRAKMGMWGGFLLAQWGVARCVGISDCNAMQSEAISIRSATSWSVPTHAALAALAALSPLVELGAGNGLWSGLLRARGADVLAFDTPRWSDEYGGPIKTSSPGQPLTTSAAGEPLMGERHACVEEGSPEEAARHTERTLVLMWPDYHGHGTYGLACLQQYAGTRLALVGEWRGRTFGAYTAGIPATGQSFSLEFQQAVEANFELEQIVRLPNWPFYLDTLMVWRRKSAK